jgi:hypothetical protein
MNVRGASARDLAEALLIYIVRRPYASRLHVRKMIEEIPGRSWLSEQEHRSALDADALLRRLGVRCLWRAMVVTEMLRRRGISARVRLSIALTSPREAHADAEVDGSALRPERADHVVLR